jgi:hypothetical protein
MSFLRFQPADAAAGFPPGSVAVLSARRGDVLGVISWYGPWRQHVLEAAPETVWSDGCLIEVASQLAVMNAERRVVAAARRRERREVTA